jgi:uncharacterized membrane protein YgdD (TMEM256/DUF423 family)
LLLAGLGGLSALVLASLGSHAIPGMDEPDRFKVWQTANMLHFLHVCALLALAPVYKQSESRLLMFSAFSFASGVLLFSGGIYLSFFEGFEQAGRFTPAGGSILMLGWVMIIIYALKSDS